MKAPYSGWGKRHWEGFLGEGIAQLSRVGQRGVRQTRERERSSAQKGSAVWKSLQGAWGTGNGLMQFEGKGVSARVINVKSGGGEAAHVEGLAQQMRELEEPVKGFQQKSILLRSEFQKKDPESSSGHGFEVGGW